MLSLIRTELLALRTTRLPWALVAGPVLLTAGLAVNAVLGAGQRGAPSIGTAGAMLAVLDATGPGRLVILLLGVLIVTAEFRHGTVTATFLHNPQRIRVLVAKAAASVAAAAVAAAGALAVAVAVGLATGALAPALLNPDIVVHVAGLQLAYPLYGLIGVAAGALIVYQPVAVLLPLAWALYLEGFTLSLAPDSVASWSLNGVTAALAHSGTLPDVLPVAVGGTVLAAYTLFLLSLGAVRLARRDIT
jgi:ABC-2 type transport system permease protein